MRKLILTRGTPGAGKTTLLNALGLAPFTLSMDAIRHLRASPILLNNGTMGISQEHNAAVAEEYRKLAETRMARGELLALDATMPTQADLAPWLAMAKEARYEVLVLDFSALPLDEALRRNQGRDAITRVPDGAVTRVHGLLQQPISAPGATVVDGTDPTAVAQVRRFLDVPVRDFSRFKQVVHIGDLQGCLSVLIGPQGPLAEGFRDDTAYVFVGDLVDRGIENGQLVRWIIDNTRGRENVFFLWGNHEDHLNRMAKGLVPVSPEFRDRTLPQLVEAGVTPEEVGQLCDRFLEVLPYDWNGQKVMVTHAGLATVPERFAEVSLHQYSRGTGNYEDPVDQQFERYAPKDWCQVHGHRNHRADLVQATSRSFNLEDSVEHGGHLRCVTLGANGWTPAQYRNTVFAPARARPLKAIPGTRKAGEPIPLGQVPPAWMARPSESRMDDRILEAMRSHAGVRQGTSKSHPHVVALNFTKDVFFNASWDDLLVKARGLFINRTTQEVVARGYEKFFNVGERPETQMDQLTANMQWPVTAFVKENGYLGNIGYDSETDELFIASKSTPDGDFAGWLREIFEATVPEGTRERMRRWLRDNEASMVFEVIDPVRDPHMIDYERAHLVLLDVFHRSAQPEKLPYEHLKAVGERFGLEVKRRAMEFKTPQAFAGWYKAACSDLNWRYKTEDIEGLVLEDRAGFQTKVKLPHYSFWKRMRSAKERMAGHLAQLEMMADDGLVAEKESLLERMALDKDIVKQHRGQGPEAEEAKKRLQEMGLSLAQVNTKLAGRERRERVVEQIELVITRDPHPLAHAFLTWCKDQPSQRLAQSSILELRSAFIAQAQPDPNLWNEPWEAFAQETEAPAPERRKSFKPR